MGDGLEEGLIGGFDLGEFLAKMRVGFFESRFSGAQDVGSGLFERFWVLSQF